MKYIKFWKVFGENGMFSPMYVEKFSGEDTRTYATVEQYIAVQKALYFDRKDIAELMIKESTTFALNKLLSQIDTSKKDGWKDIQYKIAVKGYTLRLKYSIAINNEIQRLKELKMLKDDSVFVFTQPYDKEWGVGLEARNYACEDPATWQGKNLMGLALTEAFHNNEERLRNRI